MFLRKFIPLSLVAVLALFAGITQHVDSGRAQGSLLAPNGPVGTSFTYQGMLTDASDNPITNTSCDFRFRLYDADTGGAQVGNDQLKPAVPVTKGSFTVTLDFGSAVFTGEARWLEVAVKCSGEASYTTLSPLQPVTAAPYATYAQTVGSHSHWGDTWGGIGTGLIISSTDGMGMEAYGYYTGIYSHSTLGSALVGWVSTTSGETSGVYGQSDSTDGSGLRGFAKASDGFTYGVRGQSDSSYGTGVYGLASATTGGTIGVLGEVASPDGRGVWGRASATTGPTNGVTGAVLSPDGRGVWGFAESTTGNTQGVLGEVHSPNGVGVLGLSQATAGIANGVSGVSTSTEGRGVFGYANAASGTTFGVFGQSDSAQGIGVYGQAPVTGTLGIATSTSGSAKGVYGRSDSTSGYGVYGFAPHMGAVGIASSTDGTGVFGWANATGGATYGIIGRTDSNSGSGVWGNATATTGTTYGVYGQTLSPTGIGVYGRATATTGAIGVYSYGDIVYTGNSNPVTLSKNYGWLSLYTAASTEALFEDTGTAQMVDGIALVTIDPMFAETVNLNVPYQVFLTPRGDCGLYLAETTPASFTVRALGGAKCSLAFDYRIVAKRSGYEDVRMAPAADPNLAVQNAMPPEDPQP